MKFLRPWISAERNPCVTPSGTWVQRTPKARREIEEELRREVAAQSPEERVRDAVQARAAGKALRRAMTGSLMSYDVGISRLIKASLGVPSFVPYAFSERYLGIAKTIQAFQRPLLESVGLSALKSFEPSPAFGAISKTVTGNFGFFSAAMDAITKPLLSPLQPSITEILERATVRIPDGPFDSWRDLSMGLSEKLDALHLQSVEASLAAENPIDVRIAALERKVTELIVQLASNPQRPWTYDLAWFLLGLLFAIFLLHYQQSVLVQQ